MRLQVKGKNVEVSDTLKAYAEEKLGKLDKHLNDGARLEVELAVEKNPSIAESQIAEGTIWTKGGTWTHDLGTDARIGLVSMGGSGFTANFDYVRVYTLSR